MERNNLILGLEFMLKNQKYDLIYSWTFGSS